MIPITSYAQCNFVKYPEEHFGEEQTTPFDTVDGDRPIIQGSGEVRILKCKFSIRKVIQENPLKLEKTLLSLFPLERQSRYKIQFWSGNVSR